jgi:Histidine phosphatase superfamily (branch 1)
LSKELLHLFKTSEGEHIAVVHDLFITENTKDRLGMKPRQGSLGIYLSYPLDENQPKPSSKVCLAWTKTAPKLDSISLHVYSIRYRYICSGYYLKRSSELTHLYFVRHGDYLEGLENGTYQDLGLSPEGIRQMERLRDRLTMTGEIKADVLLASPMQRAKASADILALALGLPAKPRSP